MASSAHCHCVNESSPVHYGDTVLFYLSLEGDPAGVKSGYTLGLKESLIVYPAKKEQPVLPNIESATFKIVAAQNYEAAEKFRKLRETHKSQPKVTLSKEWRALIQAEIDLKLEERENSDIQKRTAGLVVYYDTKIQLQHVITKKFIAVYTKRPSETDHDRLKVYTQSENGAECIFEVVRKLTLQCNKIHYCDQLKLESSIIKGHYLDYSKTSLPIDAASITKESYEVNLAANAKSLITIFPHYYATIHMDEQDTLKGGNTVRLFQPRYQAYMVTDFKVKDIDRRAEDYWPDIIIDCHVFFKQQAFPSNISPNKHWQFEICRDPKSGQPMCWDDECHIKHRTAEQYLTISEDKKVELIKCTEHHSKSIRFKLIPVSVKSSEHVKAGANFHIFHIATKTYLQFPDDSSQKLQWQDSILPIEALKEKPNFENAFTYEKVDDIVLKIKNEVMEILMKLKFNIDHKHFNGVVKSIGIIHHFMLNSKNQKLQNFIKIVRNMKVVSILFQYYKIVRRFENGRIKCLVQDFPYEETRNAIFRFTSDYLKRDKKGDQFALLFSALSTMELNSMLTSEKTERFTLDLIAILVENNQNIVTQTRFEGTLMTLITFWIDREMMLSKRLKTEVQRKLIKPIQSGSSHMKGALSCTASDVGPEAPLVEIGGISQISSLYSHLTKQILATTITDVGPQASPVQSGEISLFKPISSRSSHTTEVLAYSTSDVGPEATPVKSGVISIRNQSQICSKYLTILSFFCECNGIPLRNNQEIILKRLNLVDKTRLKEELDDFTRRPWLKGQVEGCYVLQAAFFKFIVKFYLDNQKLLPAYQSQLLVFQRAQVIHGIICWELAEVILTTLIRETEIGQKKHSFVAENKEDLHKVLQKDIVENYDELRWWIIKEFKRISGKIHEFSSHFLKKVLNVMNLALEVEHAHMLQEFIESTWNKIPTDLTDFGNPQDSSTKEESMTELVENKLEVILTQCKKFEETNLDSPQVSSIKVPVLKLIDKCYSDKHSIFTKAKSTHLCITSLHLHVDLNVIKSVLRQVGVIKEDQTKFEICVRNIEEECFQFEKPYAKTAQKRSQHIVESSGIISEILLLLSKEETDTWWLNSECFNIINAVSYENVEIQERFLNHVELFLKHSSNPHYGHQVGKLFSLIFSGQGDHRFTLAIKEKYIVFMLRRIFGCQETVLKKGAEFTAAILAYMKISSLGLPIQHNQVIVIKHFSSMRQGSMSCLKELLNLQGSCNTLKQFIETPSLQHGTLEKMLMMTDILASCSEGHHAEIEAVCSTIYKPHEIIDVICSLSIPLHIKRPFIRFLTWVYITSDNTHQQMEVCEGLKNVLNQQEEILKSAIGMFEEFSIVEHCSDHYLRLKRNLYSAEWKYCHKWRSDSPESQSNHQRLADHILYIIEGVIPFINALLSEDELMKRITFPKNLLKCLIDFHLMAAPEKNPGMKSRSRLFFPHSLDMKTSISCMQKALPYISDSLCVPQIKQLETQEKGYERSLSSSNNKEVEEKLNEELREFIDLEEREFSTQSSPLGINHVGSCGRIHDCEGNGILKLPSGTTFQKHIKLLFYQNDSFDLRKAETSMKLLFQCVEKSVKVYKDTHEMRRVQQERLDMKHVQLIRGLLQNHIVQVKSEVESTDAVEYRRKLTEVCGRVITLIKESKLLSKTISLLNHPCDRVVLQVLALLNDILYMLNYGYPSAENPSHTNGWADPHDFDLVSLLKVNKNLFFKEIKKKLKQSAIFYDQSQYLVQQRTKSVVDKPVNTLTPPEEQKTTIEMDHPVHNSAQEIPLSQLTNHECGENASTQLCSISDNYQESSRQNHEKKLLELQETSNVFLIMNILSKMCDGQKTVVQDYLRDQKGSTGSENIVAEVALFMKIYMRHGFNNRSYFQLIALLIRTLLEMCVGNLENKKVIIDQGILKTINSILRIDMNVSACAEDHSHTQQCVSQQDILLVKSNALELLKTFLEETSQNSGECILRVGHGLDRNALYHSIEVLYYYFKRMRKDKKDKMAAEQALFTAYHILLQLGHHPGLQELYDISGVTQDSKVWEYCEKKSLSVEIMYSPPENPEDKVLTRVYFQSEYKDFLRPEVKEFIKWNVDRSSEKEKLRNLLSWMKCTKRDILHHHKLFFWKHSILRPFLLIPTSRYWILLFLTFLMNILVLVSLSLPAKLLDSRNSTDINIVISPSVENWFYPTLGVFGILHFIFAFWMAAEYFLANVPHFVKGPIWMDSWKIWLSKTGVHCKRDCRCCKRRKKKEMPCSYSIRQDHHKPMRRIQSNLICFDEDRSISVETLASKTQIDLKEYDKMDGVRLIQRYWNGHFSLSINLALRRRVIPVKVLQPRKIELYEQHVLGFRSLYILIFVLCSFLAFFTTGYVYCLCLFYIIENNDLLQRAIKCISKNGSSLLWVAALILVWIYVYSVLSFAFFHQSFTDSGLFCNTLSECFVTVMRIGLLDSLGLFIPFRTANFHEAGLRLLFDISFFVIITTISLSITFSIILDAFSTTQQERLDAIKDMESTCFICGLSKDKFDYKKEGFDNHVWLHHNMWAYFYYNVYLDQMDPNDHTAVDTYVYRKICEENTDFLPIEEALELKCDGINNDKKKTDA